MKINPLLRDWCNDALTVFLNGVLSGLGGGSLVGAGTAGAMATDAGDSLTQNGRLYATLGAAALAVVGNGIKRVLVWHDTHNLPPVFVLGVPDIPNPPLPPATETFDKLP